MSFLTDFIRHSQNVVDDTVKHAQNVTEDVIKGGQDVTEGVTAGIFGKKAVEDFEKRGVMGMAQGIQGDWMKGGIGNVAGAFGVDPKILLMVGAAIAIVVIVMVISK